MRPAVSGGGGGKPSNRSCQSGRRWMSCRGGTSLLSSAAPIAKFVIFRPIVSSYREGMTDLDPCEVKILRELQRDASQTTAEIAERVGLSVSPCWRRIDRLEREGYVRKRVAILDQIGRAHV